jgi:hypothetical protein
MPSISFSRCLLTAALAAAAALPFAATTAAAQDGASCEQPVSRPFAPWGDLAQYSLVQDGGFEAGGAGWQLSGGARVVPGNEPFQVGGAGDAYSLRVPPGGSALSPPVCITLAHPTLRLFADGGLLSTMLVSVVLSDDGGLLQELPIGAVLLSPSWQPTLPMPVLANVLAGLTPAGELRARFRFTPLLGELRIDDVYVDPWKTT